MSVKEQIRADFPGCTTIIDQFRYVFGEQVKPIYFNESGKTMGKPSPDFEDDIEKHLWLAMTDAERIKAVRSKV